MPSFQGYGKTEAVQDIACGVCSGPVRIVFGGIVQTVRQKRMKIGFKSGSSRHSREFQYSRKRVALLALYQVIEEVAGDFPVVYKLEKSGLVTVVKRCDDTA